MKYVTWAFVLAFLLPLTLAAEALLTTTENICTNLGGMVIASNETGSEGLQPYAVVEDDKQCWLPTEIAEEVCLNVGGYVIGLQEGCKEGYFIGPSTSNTSVCCIPSGEVVEETLATTIPQELPEIAPETDTETCEKLEGYVADASEGCKEDYEDLGFVDEAQSRICCAPLPKLPEVKPGLGLMFGNLIDRVRLAFTFNRAKKAEVALRIAEKRLAEIKHYMETGEIEKAEKAQRNYNKTISRINKWVKRLGDGNTAVGQEKALERIARLEERIELHKAKLEAVKARILKRMEEQNKTNIEHIRGVFHKIEQNTNATGNHLLAIRRRALLKYKALSGKSEEEAEQVMNKFEQRFNLSRYRALRAQVQLARAARQLRRLRARVQRFNDTNLTKVVRVQARLLEMAKERLRQRNYTSAWRAAMELVKEGEDISTIARRIRTAEQAGNKTKVKQLLRRIVRRVEARAVSYTHLTLPTKA